MSETSIASFPVNETNNITVYEIGPHSTFSIPLNQGLTIRPVNPNKFAKVRPVIAEPEDLFARAEKDFIRKFNQQHHVFYGAKTILSFPNLIPVSNEDQKKYSSLFEKGKAEVFAKVKSEIQESMQNPVFGFPVTDAEGTDLNDFLFHYHLQLKDGIVYGWDGKKIVDFQVQGFKDLYKKGGVTQTPIDIRPQEKPLGHSRYAKTESGRLEVIHKDNVSLHRPAQRYEIVLHALTYGLLGRKTPTLKTVLSKSESKNNASGKKAGLGRLRFNLNYVVSTLVSLPVLMLSLYAVRTMVSDSSIQNPLDLKTAKVVKNDNLIQPDAHSLEAKYLAAPSLPKNIKSGHLQNDDVGACLRAAFFAANNLPDNASDETVNELKKNQNSWRQTRLLIVKRYVQNKADPEMCEFNGEAVSEEKVETKLTNLIASHNFKL